MRLDYLYHIIAGFLISGLTAFLIHFWNYDWMILSALFAFLIGVAKEYIWDRWFKKGTFEWQDIYCTFYGGLLATVISYIIWY